MICQTNEKVLSFAEVAGSDNDYGSIIIFFLVKYVELEKNM